MFKLSRFIFPIHEQCDGLNSWSVVSLSCSLRIFSESYSIPYLDVKCSRSQISFPAEYKSSLSHLLHRTHYKRSCFQWTLQFIVSLFTSVNIAIKWALYNNTTNAEVTETALLHCTFVCNGRLLRFIIINPGPNNIAPYEINTQTFCFSLMWNITEVFKHKEYDWEWSRRCVIPTFLRKQSRFPYR